jgi:hexosaminidase
MERLRDLATLEPYDRNLPDSTRFYAAEAEACFKVKETGVYRFSSDCDAVWIDDVLLINNGDEIKRYSRHDAELALEKGIHKVRAVFVFNILGGWNTLKNKTDVQIRKSGDDEWKYIKPLSK